MILLSFIEKRSKIMIKPLSIGVPLLSLLLRSHAIELEVSYDPELKEVVEV